MAWEKKALQHLALTRQDLMMRLVWNGLSLGYKRTHLPFETQTHCPNCDDNELETPHHLFVQCTLARTLWIKWGSEWQTTEGERITWRDLINRKKMKHTHWKQRLPPAGGTLDQIWTIVKAAVIRAIWIERNQRVFHPDKKKQDAMTCAHQAGIDIQIHLSSMIRRTSGSDRQQTRLACKALEASSRHHRDLIWRVNNATRHTKTEDVEQPSTA